jgi:hypothetical protein
MGLLCTSLVSLSRDGRYENIFLSCLPVAAECPVAKKAHCQAALDAEIPFKAKATLQIPSVDSWPMTKLDKRLINFNENTEKALGTAESRSKH